MSTWLDDDGLDGCLAPGAKGQGPFVRGATAVPITLSGDEFALRAAVASGIGAPLEGDDDVLTPAAFDPATTPSPYAPAKPAPARSRAPVAVAAALVVLVVGGLAGAAAARFGGTAPVVTSSSVGVPPAPVAVTPAPATVAPVAAAPVPAPRSKAGAGRVWTVPFSFDSVTIAGPLHVPAWVETCGQVQVTGHTCDLGDAHANYTIGLGRAVAVRDRLVDAGFPSARIDIRSAGDAEPAVPGDTPAARRANRRATVTCLSP